MTKNKSKANKNLYLMKLLVSADKFQAEVAQIRASAGITDGGFLNDDEFRGWQKKLEKNSDTLLKKGRPICELPINKFYNSMETLVGKYNLPYNFLNALKTYILRNKIIPLYLPSSGYAIAFSPKKGRAKWIDLRVYSRLTEKEIRQAIKDLRADQEHYLSPALNMDIRIRKDINLVLEMAEKMKNRRLKMEEIPNDYLKKVREQYDEKQYKLAKKENPSYITKVKKYTSGSIAKEFFNDKKKSYRIRQINSRLCKERKKLFGI